MSTTTPEILFPRFQATDLYTGSHDFVAEERYWLSPVETNYCSVVVGGEISLTGGSQDALGGTAIRTATVSDLSEAKFKAPQGIDGVDLGELVNFRATHIAHGFTMKDPADKSGPSFDHHELVLEQQEDDSFHEVMAILRKRQIFGHSVRLVINPPYQFALVEAISDGKKSSEFGFYEPRIENISRDPLVRFYQQSILSLAGYTVQGVERLSS